MPKHVRVLKEKRRARILPILVSLLSKGVATAAEVGCSPVEISRIQADGLVKQVDIRKSGKRGRPAHEYRLTDAGRKRAKRGLVAA